MEFNGLHQLLVYVDDVNIFGKSLNTINKNIEALSKANRKVGLFQHRDDKVYSYDLSPECRTES
jgi:hypothetical protein